MPIQNSEQDDVAPMTMMKRLSWCTELAQWMSDQGRCNNSTLLEVKYDHCSPPLALPRLLKKSMTLLAAPDEPA